MAELLTLFCVFSAMVAPLVLVVGGLLLYRRWEAGRWDAAASQLGLVLDPAPSSGPFGLLFRDAAYVRRPMRGTRAGLAVEVGIRAVVTRGRRNRQVTYYSYARVNFPKPLDLGLSITPVGIIGRAFTALAGAGDLQVGHPMLDPAYSIHAADSELVRALVRTPWVEEALMALAQGSFRPYIDDSGLRCERKGKAFDPRELAVALDSAVDLARRVLAAREQIGPSSAVRAVAEAWRPVAQARGLALDVEATRMAGRVDGIYVEVDAQLRGQQRWTVFTARFDRPLGVGLKLTRQGALSGIGKLLGMQDIEVGDPLFDARFVVKGAPTAQVRALLTPEVRARFVELQSQATQLTIEDDHLSAEVRWLVTDPAGLDLGVVSIARAGAALLQVQEVGAGPYRR